MSGSGKQLLVSVLQELSTSKTETQDLPEATAKIRAGLLLHGSTAEEHCELVQKLAWIEKEDADGDVSIQGIGVKSSGVLLSEVMDTILATPSLKSHVLAQIPSLDASDYDASEHALSLLVTCVQMFAELLPVEQNNVNVDSWMTKLKGSSLGKLLRE